MHSASQTFALAVLELFHLDLLFVTPCIFFLQAVDVTGCLPVLVLHRSDRNFLIDKRKNRKFWGWPQLARFTHSLIISPGKCTLQLVLACNLPGTPEYSLLHPFILDQIFRRTQCTEMQHLRFHKRILWKPGMYFVAKMDSLDSLGNLVLTIMKNSGKITSASFDTKCSFCRSCKLQCSRFTEACTLQGDDKNSKYPFFFFFIQRCRGSMYRTVSKPRGSSPNSAKLSKLLGNLIHIKLYGNWTSKFPRWLCKTQL